MSNWRKVSGDVNAREHGATYALEGDGTTSLVEICPKDDGARAPSKEVYVRYAEYSYEDIQVHCTSEVLAYMGLEPPQNTQTQALALFLYGWGVDTEVFPTFAKALKSFTGHSKDISF